MAGVHIIDIVESRPVGSEFRYLTLSSPEITGEAEAGQFVHVRCGHAGGPLLRRPLSICHADPDRGELGLFFRILGKGTKWMAERRVGDKLDVLGPVGNTFLPPEEGQRPVLVGGGMGTAPMLFLAETLARRGWRPVTLLGAVTSAGLFFKEELAALGDVLTATDDGSEGHKGYVTDLLAGLLDGGLEGVGGGFGDDGMRHGIHRGAKGAGDSSIDTGAENAYVQQIASAAGFQVYACGPKVMMKKVADLAAAAGGDAQVSLEEHMACGVGACLVCVCRTKSGGHRRVCADGPVFRGSEVDWDA